MCNEAMKVESVLNRVNPRSHIYSTSLIFLQNNIEVLSDECKNLTSVPPPHLILWINRQQKSAPMFGPDFGFPDLSYFSLCGKMHGVFL